MIANVREGFDIAVTAPVILIDDVESGREFLKPYYALYIGGMGARGKNFYNDLACRYGYEDAARKVQDLYLDGNKRDAAAAVPDAFIDDVALVGPKSASRSGSTRGASPERRLSSSRLGSLKRCGLSPRSRCRERGSPRPVEAVAHDRCQTPICVKGHACRISANPSTESTRESFLLRSG